jgi:hypothetical protein
MIKTFYTREGMTLLHSPSLYKCMAFSYTLYLKLTQNTTTHKINVLKGYWKSGHFEPKNDNTNNYMK